MASVSQFLIKKLRLKVNEAKSGVTRLDIVPNALDKFKTQIRENDTPGTGYQPGALSWVHERSLDGQVKTIWSRIGDAGAALRVHRIVTLFSAPWRRAGLHIKIEADASR
jgi:hypothetical protein